MVEHRVLDLLMEAHLVLLTASGTLGQVGVPAVRVAEKQDQGITK